MSNFRKTFLAFAVLGTIALLAAPASAKPVETVVPAGQGAGQGAQLGFGFTDDIHGWNVTESYYGHINVYLDSNVGPWQKLLGTPGSGFGAGEVYTLIEVLKVGEGPDPTMPASTWTDYHETILTPGWQWYQDPFGAAWTFTSNQAGLTAANIIDDKKLNVDWTFSPTANLGTTMTITKYLTYTGEGNPTAPLVVAQYPTTVPEPSTLVLLLVGATSALAYAWRKRR